MAIADTHPTLRDLASRLDPDGSISVIAELLSEMNPVLQDMPMVEGNLTNGYQGTIRRGLPAPTWRRLNQGVLPSKSQTGQVTFSCGTAEMYSEVDKELADLNGNTSAFRMSEDMAHIEGMSQEIANKIFYGAEGSEEAAFTGLSHYYNQKSAESGDNIIDGGGTGSDNFSIWLVCWGDNKVFGTYPKASMAGLKHEDKGQVTSEVQAAGPNGGRLEVYRSWYQWKIGLAVKDWRYAVRIANIDKSDVAGDPWKTGYAGANIQDMMVQASELPPMLNAGMSCFYANRTVITALRRQLLAAKNPFLGLQELGGKHVMTFDGTPIKRVDALHTTEARVT